MAIVIDAWQHEGKGQVSMHTRRVGREGLKTALNEVLAHYVPKRECVLITYTHTGRTRTVMREVFHRPGYIDPCA